IVSILLLIAALTGWFRGFLIALLYVAEVLCAYTAAVLAARFLGTPLSEWTDWPRIISIPIAGTLAFILVSVLFSILISHLKKRTRQRKKNGEFKPSLLNQGAGAITSLAAAMVMLILIFWTYDALCASPFGTRCPPADQSLCARLSKVVIFKTAKWMIPADTPEEKNLQARLISEPGETLSKLESALMDPQINHLLQDRTMGKAVLSGDAIYVERCSAFQNLFRNKDTIAHLTNLGLLEGESPKRNLASLLAENGAKMQKRMNHPEVEHYIAELRYDGLLNPEAFPKLVRDIRFLKIADHLLIPTDETHGE
ncbi:MAG: CvpA family protein, partial [Kiritimatiellaceae bacterium]|nr:CvpA family protein [Kiritimatiellaceae bacterium]